MSEVSKQTIELLPCPFCGARGKDLEIRPDYAEDDITHIIAYHVHCTGCYARGRILYPGCWAETPEQAIEAWNNRFVPATIPGEPDRVQISTTALRHIWGELDRIENIKKHIDDLLTPIQMTR